MEIDATAACFHFRATDTPDQISNHTYNTKWCIPHKYHPSIFEKRQTDIFVWFKKVLFRASEKQDEIYLMESANTNFSSSCSSLSSSISDLSVNVVSFQICWTYENHSPPFMFILALRKVSASTEYLVPTFISLLSPPE